MLERQVAFADMVLSNGRIYTVNPAQPWVEAVAISGGKYTYVGDAAGLGSHIGPETRQLDLQGRMAMPGINDVHSHPWQGGTKVLYGCNFAFSATPEEIADIISECVARDPDAQWIIGGQWTSDFFKNHELGSPREWLDRVSGDKAVYLEDDSGHHGWVNSKALALAGVSKDTPDPAGGVFLRDTNGEPNGVALESAKTVVEEVIPQWTHEQNVAALTEAVKRANAFGITGILEARTPPSVSPAYATLDQQGLLTTYAITALQTPRGKRDTAMDVAPLIEISERYSSEHVHTRFAKIFLDGVPTASRSAVMLEPYLVNEEFSEPTTGMLMVAPEVLAEDIAALDRNGFTVKIHTAGDGAVRVALDAIEQVRSRNGRSGLRHQLAHAGYIHPDDIQRFVDLNVTADLSPYLWFPRPIIDSIIGAVGQRAYHYWPIKDLLAAGVNVSIGSDWPSAAASMDPWPALEAMVTRRNPWEDGEQALWRSQAISLEQALEIFTRYGARAYRLEHLTGSVEVGKSADLIVLNQDLFSVPVEKISETRPELTLFKGTIVFETSH
ncbi:MAG: amidohydrolase [Gammaproteobacteria bacterium]|nr:amidohydrolase [Gammaproteobacteria bacterium]